MLLIYNSNLLLHYLKLAELLTEVLGNVHSFRSHLLWVNFRAFNLLQCDTLVIVLHLLLQTDGTTFRNLIKKISLCLFNLVVCVCAKSSQLNALLWVRYDIDWRALKSRSGSLLLRISTTRSACWRSANK